MRRFLFLISITLSLVIFGSQAVLCRNSDDTFIEVFFNDPTLTIHDRTLQDMVLHQINRAQESIDIAIYNFTDTYTRDALIKAAKNGVEIRIVIDEDNRDASVLKELEKAGAKVVIAQSNGLMHSKYIIIDNDIAISGSANLTVGSFFYDNNFLILIQSEEVNQIFKAEFNEMFEERLFGDRSPKTTPPDMITLDDGTRLLVRFSPDDSVEDILVSLINASSKSIQVLAYSFSSNDLGNALIRQYEAGLDVSVIFEKEKAYRDSGGEAEFLERAGVPIYMDGSDGLMHEKVFIFDKSIVAAGSYNFTRSADERNDEQILIIDNPKITEQFLREYELLLIDASQP